jgi:hypothetical protein
MENNFYGFGSKSKLERALKAYRAELNIIISQLGGQPLKTNDISKIRSAVGVLGIIVAEKEDIDLMIQYQRLLESWNRKKIPANK